MPVDATDKKKDEETWTRVQRALEAADALPEWDIVLWARVISIWLIGLTVVVAILCWRAC